jgi:shikimate kinase/3-dehydroquinate synthase
MMRPLLVVGPPRPGKSELARSVAELTGRPLIDADTEGLESHLEMRVVQSPIINVKSDVWLNRTTRVMALDRSVVVSVYDSDGHDGTRQALHADSREDRLWDAALPAFREAHRVVQFDPQKLPSLAEEVAAIWRRDPMAVAAGDRSYLVDIGRGIVEERFAALLGRSATILFITDSNVECLHGARIEAALRATGSRAVKVVFAAGEEQKHLTTLGQIFDQAKRGGIDRTSPVIAVGGGVVTDIGGFAAATWMRGLRWISVPTTLLGMVDASVGGKTAVDFGDAKNAVGAFWQPAAVVCDIDWLQTESKRNFISALAEVVKTAIIGDAELFKTLEQERESILQRDPDLLADVVRRCVRVKARIVALDERESGLRAVLNLGHTVGHALEAQGGYGRWTHGEAVSLGLVAALRLGQRLGFTAAEVVCRAVDLLKTLGLPVWLGDTDLIEAAELISYDKKRAGSMLRFVFVKGIGEVNCQSLLLQDLRDLMPFLSD